MTDYIDRDGYIKSQRELYCKNCPKREGMRNGKKQELYPIGGVVCRACELHDALNALEDYPAADVAPVVRGRWLTGNDNPRTYGRIRAMCGRCGTFALAEMVNAGSYKEQLSNFCPNCGAKMEETE